MFVEKLERTDLETFGKDYLNLKVDEFEKLDESVYVRFDEAFGKIFEFTFSDFNCFGQNDFSKKEEKGVQILYRRFMAEKFGNYSNQITNDAGEQPEF